MRASLHLQGRGAYASQVKHRKPPRYFGLLHFEHCYFMPSYHNDRQTTILLLYALDSVRRLHRDVILSTETSSSSQTYELAAAARLYTKLLIILSTTVSHQPLIIMYNIPYSRHSANDMSRRY